MTEAQVVIPLIDLSALSSPDSLSNVVAEIGNACKNWGFFQVINHGVPSELRQKIELASKKFFSLPSEEKGKVRRDETNPMGYYDSEHTKNVKDWKEVFDLVAESPTFMPASHEPNDKELKELINRWPEYPPEFKEACEEYAKRVKELGFKLVELISLSLGLPGDRLSGLFKDPGSFIRINHYPPCPNPNQALGVGQHKDTGALTILAQDDVGGLEVKRKTDGLWIPVKPTPNAYIINLGDILQVWSNDIYESVEHRVVVNSKKERYSIVFLFCPAHNVNVEPLEELTSEQNPSKYSAYNWGKFNATRKLSNFKKLDVENIQVSQFKIAK